MKRRTLLLLVGSVTASGLLAKLPFISFAGRPRFPHRTPAKPLIHSQPKGFYLNRKTGGIRYLGANKVLPDIYRLNWKNYESLTFDRVIQRLNDQRAELRLNEQRAEQGEAEKPINPFLTVIDGMHVLEQLAVERIRNGQHGAARQLLWLNATDKNSEFWVVYSDRAWRLYDLLAGLSARYGTEGDYKTFLEVLPDGIGSKGNPAEKRQFAARVDKWKNTKSKWYIKWSNKNRRVFWAGLLM